MIENEQFTDKPGQAEAETGKNSGWPTISLPGSVIIGALLISASIFYNTNLLIRNLGQGALGQQAAVNAAPAGQAQPAAPVRMTLRSDEPILGNSNAKVTVVEFGDFQCPYCQSFTQQTFPQVKAQYIDTGKIKFIFRHFPLPFHINAQISAVAAECSNRQGKFWPYHDLLYKNGQADGTNLDKASLEKYAGSLGLNSGTFGFGANKFNQCLEQNATLAVVNADSAEGAKDGVSGTPSFLVIKNGQLDFDVGYIQQQQNKRQDIISLPNGNMFIVGAQAFAQFQQALDTVLK